MSLLTKGICQVIQLIGRKYPRCPKGPREICQVVSTDEQELFKMTQLTKGICEVTQLIGRKYPICPFCLREIRRLFQHSWQEIS
jgi:hypothetical protein